jgi:hypothetical protein
LIVETSLSVSLGGSFRQEILSMKETELSGKWKAKRPGQSQPSWARTSCGHSREHLSQ